LPFRSDSDSPGESVRQPGQGGSDEVSRRDLRSELLAAEAEAKDKKRKAQGLPPLSESSNAPDDPASKRRRMLQEAIALNEAEDKEYEEQEKLEGGPPKGDGNNNDDEDDDSDEEEDDTEELLRELEKIKRERAEEKERLENEKNEKNRADREEEVATANPLLNLAAALGHKTPAGTGTAGSFAVKRRWDDGMR
jgi:protein CWC15